MLILSRKLESCGKMPNEQPRVFAGFPIGKPTHPYPWLFEKIVGVPATENAYNEYVKKHGNDKGFLGKVINYLDEVGKEEEKLQETLEIFRISHGLDYRCVS